MAVKREKLAFLSFQGPIGQGGGEGLLGLIFAGYVPLASKSPDPIIVYSVANYRPHFWANKSFLRSQLGHFLFTYLPYFE